MTFTKPIPFDEAIQSRNVKGLLPTSMSSKQLSRLSTELKERAVFSARTLHAGYLQKANDLFAKIAGGATPEDFERRAAGEEPLLQDIPGARLQLRKFLDSIGYRPDPTERGGVTDLSSDRRLNLLLQTNVEMAQGYGQWIASQDETTLDNLPALELFRISGAAKPRDWPARWRLAGDASGHAIGDGWTLTEDGRMIALKNHPIWERLGDPDLFDDGLGNPYPPFAFSSGMDVRDITREEAIQLDLIDSDTQIVTQDRGFNDNLEAHASRFNSALQAALEDDPALEIRDGILRITNRARRSNLTNRVRLVRDALINAGTSEGARKGSKKKNRATPDAPPSRESPAPTPKTFRADNGK